MTSWLRLAALCLLAAAGCEATPEFTPATGREKLRPDASGIAIEGSRLRIDFGRAEDGVVKAVERILGRPPENRSVSRECGAGPVTIVKFHKIDLLFQDRAFRGWVTGNPFTVTAIGLAPGTSRRDLAAAGLGAFRTTSLGVEFDAGGVSGLLPDADPDAKVDLLWAGLTCFFR